VDDFVKSLRIIRVFINPVYEENLKLTGEHVLHINQKWVQLYKRSNKNGTA
jgi:hypothetical protein